MARIRALASADVVPVVPIKPADMELATETARALARRVGE